DDIKSLLECPSISILDLSHNKLDDPTIVEILIQLPNLAVLNLMSNPVIQMIENYRRTLVSKIKTLTYLDDRPVFDNERLAVEAWVIGGIEGERAERTRQREEQKAEQDRNFEALRKIQEDARQRRIEKYGPDKEPEFPEPLRQFRDDQLSKIAPSAEPTPQLLNASENQDTDAPETSLEPQELDIVVNRPITRVLTSNQPPIRSFLEADTSGATITQPNEPIDSDVPELENVDGEGDLTWLTLMKRAREADEVALETLEGQSPDFRFLESKSSDDSIDSCSPFLITPLTGGGRKDVQTRGRPLIEEIDSDTTEKIEIEDIQTPLAKAHADRVVATRKLMQEAETEDGEATLLDLFPHEAPKSIETPTIVKSKKNRIYLD
ncbi:Dynein assembly factor 1, axonemal, partial [Nowakowskiella sp. JEL0078]